jgi:hypothetical protein
VIVCGFATSQGRQLGEAGPAGRILNRGELGWEIIPELQLLDRWEGSYKLILTVMNNGY